MRSLGPLGITETFDVFYSLVRYGLRRPVHPQLSELESLTSVSWDFCVVTLDQSMETPRSKGGRQCAVVSAVHTSMNADDHMTDHVGLRLCLSQAQRILLSVWSFPRYHNTKHLNMHSFAE